MSSNFQEDYNLLEKDRGAFNAKIRRQWILLVIILILICIFIPYYFNNKAEVNKFLLIDITETSKDWTEKITLMRSNRTYHWPNTCPKWYHIPTLYEWEKLFRIRCEKQEGCNYEHIKKGDHNLFSATPRFKFSGYASDENDKLIKKFVSKFNIDPKWRLQNDPFPHWAYKQIKFWIKHLNLLWKTKYCESLRFQVNTRFTTLSSYIEEDYIYECKEPKYIRCFSDDNLTEKFINDENIRQMSDINETNFEIDWVNYSWYKIAKYYWKEFNKDIVIPEEYEWKPIIEIWEEAFARGWYKSVKFSKNLIKIWKEAFANNKIEEINIPENVIYIEEWAFWVNKITHLEIPDTVKHLEWWQGSDTLSSFKLQSWIKEIPDQMFIGCNLENLVIPEWIEKIWDRAFYHSNVKQVKLPSTLKEIWNSAFNCNNLTEVTLPIGIKEIWDSAFCWNSKNRDFKSNNCTSEEYVTIKWYPKDSDKCINTKFVYKYAECTKEGKNLVCWKDWILRYNRCHLRIDWVEEDPTAKIVDLECVHE